MHNFGEMTDKCIEIVRKNAGIEHEILVVDDFSDVPYENKDAKVIRLKEHSGFTKAINVGLRVLRLNYDYVCLLNNDTEPCENFLKSMVENAETDPVIGIVGAGRVQNKEPYVVAMWGTDLTTGTVAASHDDQEEPGICVWIPFCCVLLSKNCVESVGLLDEKLINHCSDNDYCLRAIFMGFCVLFDPKAKVIHYQSATINSLGIAPYEDQKIFIQKWLGTAMNEILDKIPVNDPMKKWARIGVKYEEREEAPRIIQP